MELPHHLSPPVLETMLDQLTLFCLPNMRLDLHPAKAFVHHDFFDPLESRDVLEPKVRVHARVNYFPIPARLFTNCRCNTRYKIRIGSVAIVTEASNNGQFEA
jgi:hypothetical protein